MHFYANGGRDRTGTGGGERRGILYMLKCEYMLEEGTLLDSVAGKDSVIDIHIYLYKWRKSRARSGMREKTVLYIIYTGGRGRARTSRRGDGETQSLNMIMEYVHFKYDKKIIWCVRAIEA